MKKIVTIVGARPQFVKIPLISREIRKFATEVIVHTGQHYDDNMSAIFFKDLNIPMPDYNLGVGSASREEQIQEMQVKIEEVLLKEKPDMILVYGDTNSTLAAAKVGKKLDIPIAHVEAGMRSYNLDMPEELNRVEADQISTLLFCSTESAVQNLKKEGITKGVYWTGDVMNDIQKKVSSNEYQASSLEKLNLESKEYILATVHRQANTDIKENLTNIIEAFNAIGATIVFPMHPRTKKYIKEYGLELSSNIKVIEPLGYQEMIALETNARLILTDSGGVQKEAYVAKVPCVTLRDETEWTETVESGWNQLAGADTQKILELVKNFPQPKNHPEFLGDGTAYIKIVQIIERSLGS